MRNLSRCGPGLVGLSLLMVAATPARAAEVESLLPDDTELIISVNLQQLIGSEVVKKHALDLIRQQIKQSAEAQQLIEATGLDPLKDVERVTAAGPFDPQGGGDSQPVIIVQGKFDKKRLQDAAAKFAAKEPDKIEVVTEGDKTLYKFTPEKGGDTMFGVIADDSTLIVAPTKEQTLAALARAQGGKAGKLKKDLADMWAKLDKKQSVVMAAVTKGKFENMPLPNPQAGQVMEKIDGMSMSLNITDGIAGAIGLLVTDADQAKEMGAMMKQALPQAKQFAAIFALQQPQLKEPLTELAESLKADVSGKTITLKASLSADSVEKLIQAAKMGGLEN